MNLRIWVQPSGEESTLDFVQVPIFAGEERWGILQIAFSPQVKLSGFHLICLSHSLNLYHL